MRRVKTSSKGRQFVEKADPLEVGGRQVNRVTSGTVKATGRILAYGNDIRVFRLDNVLLAVLADQLPRWWRINLDSGTTANIVFNSPGYICTIEGSVVSGANIPQITQAPGSTVDIACSHNYSLWAEFDRPSVNLQQLLATRFIPCALTARTSLPLPNPASVLNNPFAQVNKPFTEQAVTNYGAGSTFFGPFPSTAGVMAGVYVEGICSGPEMSTLATIPPTYLEYARDSVYLFFYGAYKNTAGVRGDVFYLGDILQYCPFASVYGFKVAFGRQFTTIYDAAFCVLGIWAPHIEQGAGGAFSQILLNMYSIGFDQPDVKIPLGTGSGLLAGQEYDGLQGTGSAV